MQISTASAAAAGGAGESAGSLSRDPGNQAEAGMSKTSSSSVTTHSHSRSGAGEDSQRLGDLDTDKRFWKTSRAKWKPDSTQMKDAVRAAKQTGKQRKERNILACV